MSAQENEIDEAIALFGPSNGSVLSREQALDILSALGICLRGSDVDAMLPTELTAEELKAMLPQLRTKNMQREELVQLMRVS
ncbi:hypothetical protein BgAZ_402590 [Babesia gibsoni]|uniref:Uncharacterized protein n=1 Tax=Babesia gibsoni TaxID=33632 RepID=A0AAD8LHE0_BABGI|nr:hypothetical protein BgAZ_402590 [Babesia gibsoni]